MNVIAGLKSSPKGQLQYNRQAPTQTFLDECSAIPKLSSFHKELENKPPENLKYERDGTKLNEERPNEVSFTDDDQWSRTSCYEYDSDGSSNLKVTIETDRKPAPCVVRKPKTALAVSPNYSRTVLAIKDYELILDNKAKTALQEKVKEFKAHQDELQRLSQARMKEVERKALMKAVRIQESTEISYKQGIAEVQEQHQKLKEDHRQHAERLEIKHRKLQEEIQRKEQERKERVEKILQMMSDLKIVQTRIENLKPNEHTSNKLKEQMQKAAEKIRQMVNVIDQMINTENESGETNPTLLDKGKETLSFTVKVYDELKKRLDEEERVRLEEAKAKAAAEAKLKAEEEAKAKAAAAAAATTQTPGGAPLASSTPMPTASDKNAATANVSPIVVKPEANEFLCVDPEVFTQYTKLQENLKQAEESMKDLATSPQHKKTKFDLQKAINTPINAISSVSGEHLRDKLQRLLHLLSGQQVQVGNKTVSMAVHPQAQTFCKFTIARMFVKKGEEQVSSKHETAFAVAMTAVGLWSEHPDIGDLILGHFHASCPYTVPYNIPKQDGQSTVDYHKALGYKYDSDGTVEQQDKFLKRMSGLMRLYAAILVSAPPRGNNQHGISYAWMWLCRSMNIRPLPDITVTMVYDMLQVTGHILCKVYHKQFHKLLSILYREYLPKLKAVAPSSGGGPLSRLQTLLEQSIKNNGQIPPPEGYLSANFWMSR